MRVFADDIVAEESDAAIEIGLADAYHVHGNIGREEQLQRFLVTVRVVLGVLPVRYQKNNLAPLVRPVAQLLRGGVDRIVNVLEVGMTDPHGRNLRRACRRLGIHARLAGHHGRADTWKRTAEVDPLKLGEHHIGVGDKFGIGNEFRNLIEAPEGNLVGCAEAGRDRLQRLLDSRCRALLQIVVDQDGRRERKCIHREQCDFLLDAIFKNSEIILLEVRYQFPGAVFHCDGYND